MTFTRGILIPHTPGFSQLLKRWKDEKDIALVGVAYVLNLIEGGYAMKNLASRRNVFF